jgi:hypothetical protein
MSADFDFLARHGATHVVLGSGDRARLPGPLPRDAGVHRVAGTARLGGFRTLRTLPAGPALLSPDGRWLGVHCGEAWRLYDLSNGCADGYSFLPFWPRDEVSLHPSGEMVARRTPDQVELWLPDERLLASTPFPPRNPRRWGREGLTFSACGDFLWFAAAPADGDHSLTLLRVPSLEVLDRIPPPAPEQADGPARWREFLLHVKPDSDHLTVSQSAGDSFRCVTFHTVRRGKIVTRRRFVGPDDRGFEGEPLNQLAFAPDGVRFCGFDLYDLIFEWRWSDCSVQRAAGVSWFPYGGDSDVAAVAYWKDLLFVALANGGFHVLESGSLRQKRTVRPLGTSELLPNGMLLRRDRAQTMDVAAFERRREDVKAVMELDSESGRVLRVLRKQGSAWVEITGETAWVEPNFDFERE